MQDESTMRNGFGCPVFTFCCETCNIEFEDSMPIAHTETGHEMLCPECGGFTKKLLAGCTRHFSWASWRLSQGNVG